MFFDLSSGFGATLIGVAVSLTSYRGGFAVAAAIAGAGLAAQWLLRDRIGGRHLACVPDVAVTGAGSADLRPPDRPKHPPAGSLSRWPRASRPAIDTATAGPVCAASAATGPSARRA